MARVASINCLVCGIPKTNENTRHRKNGQYESYCRKCVSKRQKEEIHKNREKHNAYRRSYQQRTRPYLRRMYGMSLEQYNEMVIEQDNKCFICDCEPASKPLCVDHCHKTGKVRKLLCLKCNMVLGLLSEAPEMAIKCAIYLIYHGKK